MKSIWSKFGHEQLFHVNKKYLAIALKNTLSQSSVFFFFSLHQTTKEFLAFIKATIYAFVISIACALFSDVWLAIIWLANLIGFFELHIAHSEILLTACADQLLYNLSLIKLYSACLKQNTAVKTVGDTRSLFSK